jgi:hypothetical protein
LSPAKLLVSNEVVSDELEMAFSDTGIKKAGSTAGIVWLAFLTTVAYVFGTSLHLSNPLHPFIDH